MSSQAQGKDKKKSTTESKPDELSIFGLKVAGFELDATTAYLTAIFLSGVIQFAYIVLVGTFPFNSFLAGFLSCVTSFVLGVCLKKTDDFKGFIFAHLVLHLATLMLMG